MKAMTYEEMLEIEGGGKKWLKYVDGGCAVVGVASLFATVLIPAAAFCAGWAIGRLI